MQPRIPHLCGGGTPEPAPLPRGCSGVWESSGAAQMALSEGGRKQPGGCGARPRPGLPPQKGSNHTSLRQAGRALQSSALRTPGQRPAKAARPRCLFFTRVWGPQRGKEPQEVTTLGKHRAYCVSGMCTKAFNPPNNPTRYSGSRFTERADQARCGQVAGPRPCDQEVAPKPNSLSP